MAALGTYNDRVSLYSLSRNELTFYWFHNVHEQEQQISQQWEWGDLYT